MRNALFCFFIAFFPLLPGSAAEIKLSTWNLDWLIGDRAAFNDLPRNIPQRGARDFAQLAQYAKRLDPDIIALQEVDGAASIARLFPPSRYHIIVANENIAQRVALAVKKPLRVLRFNDLSSLDVARVGAKHHLRDGLDVTVATLHATLRILVVHLKSGCWDQPLRQHKHACPTLYRQMALISQWISERQRENVAFAVLGDFNRRLTLNDPLMSELMREGPLTLTTAGFASPCRGGDYFIDHILLGDAARAWLVRDSLAVMVYKMRDKERLLSDHCPVSVKLDLP